MENCGCNLLHPRCRLVQRRSICQNNGVRELGTGQVAHTDTPYETGHVLQFQRGVWDWRKQTDGLAQNLRDDPDRFHKITVVRKNCRHVKTALKGVQQEMGGEIDVTPLFFDFYHFHNVGPWLRKRGARAKFRGLDQTGKFLHQWTNFGTPWGLFVKGERIYVVDGTANNCLLIASTRDGKVLEKIEGLSNPTAVTVDSHDAIYVGEVNGTRVKKFVKK